jgi:hypothetical protein
MICFIVKDIIWGGCEGVKVDKSVRIFSAAPVRRLMAVSDFNFGGLGDCSFFSFGSGNSVC